MFELTTLAFVAVVAAGLYARHERERARTSLYRRLGLECAAGETISPSAELCGVEALGPDAPVQLGPRDPSSAPAEL